MQHGFHTFCLQKPSQRLVQSREGEIDSNSPWGKWQNTERVCEARDMLWLF